MNGLQSYIVDFDCDSYTSYGYMCRCNALGRMEGNGLLVSTNQFKHWTETVVPEAKSLASDNDIDIDGHKKQFLKAEAAKLKGFLLVKCLAVWPVLPFRENTSILLEWICHQIVTCICAVLTGCWFCARPLQQQLTIESYIINYLLL